MSLPPLLLQPSRLRHTTRGKRLSQCGKLAAWCEQSGLRELINVWPGIPESSRALVARELALLSSDFRKGVLAQLPEIMQVPLFPDHPLSLSGLGNRQFSMALFPLTGSGGANDLGVVARVEGEGEALLDAPSGWTGDSWTLAEGLCAALLDTADASHRIRLVSEFVVTGILKTDKSVGRVKIGNKLMRQDCSQRTWMVPMANIDAGEVPDDPSLLRVGAANLDSALAHIKGRGVRDGGQPTPWPEDVAELHSFTSEAMEPVLMACDLAGDIPISLWSSDNPKSYEPGKLLYRLLSEDLKYHRVDHKAKKVSSRSVSEIERLFERELGPILRKGKLVLFNITQGNFLMRLGITVLARRYSNLWLIYRDFDEQTRPVFDVYRFPDERPFTQQIEATIPENTLLNWDELFKSHAKPEDRITDSERMNRIFLKKIPESTSTPAFLEI